MAISYLSLAYIYYTAWGLNAHAFTIDLGNCILCAVQEMYM